MTVGVLLWIAATPVLAQNQTPTLTQLAADAEQAVTAAENALSAAAPEAYRAFVAALKVRNGLRQRVAAEKAPEQKAKE